MSLPRAKKVEPFRRQEIITKKTRRGNKLITRAKKGQSEGSPGLHLSEPIATPSNPGTPSGRFASPSTTFSFQLEPESSKKNVSCVV